MNKMSVLLNRSGWKKIVFTSALLLSGAALAVPQVPVVPPGAMNHGGPLGTPVQILWTNDTHGFFLPVYHAEYSEVDSYAQTAATEGKVGGYAQISGLVKALRRGIWSKNTLFVDAGDTFDGSPVAQMTRGQAVIPILNAMGYDAWTPGNRDFAWPAADFYSVTSKLDFPIVCSNLIDTTTNQDPFPSYLIKQIGGLKVAFMGITSLAGGGQGFTTLGGSTPGTVLETSLSTLAATIRATENPDVVVMLSHMGYYIDQKLASRTTGIDVIVGAHTHHNVYTPPVISNADGSRQVIVVQAGSHGKFLGRLQLWVKNQHVIHYGADLVRVTAASLAANHAKPDKEVEELAEQAYAPFKAYLDQVVGQTSTVMERRGDTQSTMTNFITDAMADRYGVDTVKFPGFRYGSTIIPGPITMGDVWNIVSPNFGGDGMYVASQTGAQILALLNGGLNTEYGTDPYLWNGGDVFRMNGRVKYTYNVNAANNQHLVNVSVMTANNQSVNLMVNGVTVPANMAKVFTMATTFGAPPQQLKDVDGNNLSAVDEIADYIKSKGTVSPTLDDRAVQLDDAPANVADITNLATAPIIVAPGLAIAPGLNRAPGPHKIVIVPAAPQSNVPDTSIVSDYDNSHF